MIQSYITINTSKYICPKCGQEVTKTFNMYYPSVNLQQEETLKICIKCSQTFESDLLKFMKQWLYSKDVTDKDVEERVKWFLQWFSQRMPIPNITYKEHLVDIAETYPKAYLEKAGERFFLKGYGISLKYLERILENYKAIGGAEPWNAQYKPPTGSDWAKAQTKEKKKRPRADCSECSGSGFCEVLREDGTKAMAYCNCWTEV